MQEFINKRIKSLPPLSESTLEIQRICNDDESSIKDLTRVVEKDPMLTANILKSANSPLYGFSREVNSVERAITLFGMTTIKGFALNAAIKNTFKIDLSAYGLSEHSFARLSTTQNALALKWLGANNELKNTVIPASFLLEIGKIVVSNALIENAKADEFKAGLANIKTIRELKDYETSIIGMSSEEVTAKIFDKWNLEIDMVDSIMYSITPEKASKDIFSKAMALNIISNLVNLMDSFNEEIQSQCVVDAKKYGLMGDKLLEAIKIVNPNA